MDVVPAPRVVLCSLCDICVTLVALPPYSLPQNMVEYIIRQKIYDSFYWKQECFGLTAELLVEKGVELKYVRLSTCFALHMRGAWNACWDLSALQKIRLVHLTRFIGARKSYDGALSKRTLLTGLPPAGRRHVRRPSETRRVPLPHPENAPNTSLQ